ncbi:hypothetical protein FQN57_004993 [Myotisia sp. PD_48]|nr:hypothetical protein FQN57_004993 [Myotisia sp. PD_48]
MENRKASTYKAQRKSMGWILTRNIQLPINRPIATQRITSPGDISNLKQKLDHQKFVVYDAGTVLDLGHGQYEIGLAKANLDEFQDIWQK